MVLVLVLVLFMYRPILVLKCEQGFVGYRAGSNKLECNKANYEAVQVERGPKGLVYFKSKTNRLTNRRLKYDVPMTC